MNEPSPPHAPALTATSGRERKPNRRRTLERLVKRGVLLVFVGVVAALVVMAMLPKPVPVDVSPATRGPLKVTVDEDGTARVKDRYLVSAPLGGRLARLEHEPGDSVKQDDVLARIVPVEPALLDERTRSAAEARVSSALAAQRQAGAMVERAKANLEFTQKDSERQKSLVERGAIGHAQLDESELRERTASADVASAKFGALIADYEVEMARAALGRLSRKARPGAEDQLLVPSPISGRVLNVHHKSEGVLAAGTPLLELVVDVLTSDAVSLRPGATASIEEWGGPPLAAHVRIIEPSAFTRLSGLGVEEQRVNVVLELDGRRDAWAALGDGYRIKAKIVTHEKLDALRVPASAVFRHEEGWAVFVVTGDTARLTSVTLGLRTMREVEIEAGLALGARVVLHPSDRVRDGVKVTVR